MFRRPARRTALRYDFPLGGQLVDIVVSGGTDVAIYKIDPVARQLVDITARAITATYDAWGVCSTTVR